MNQPRILILGASGMLGHKIFQQLSNRFSQVSGTVRGDLSGSPFRNIELFQTGRIHTRFDAAVWDPCEAMLHTLRPDFLINCVGIVKQRPSAKAAIPSILINSLLPHRLAEVAAGWGGRVIHFSTDCVFSGRLGLYTEDDPSDAEDLYGRSKFLGEVSVSNALTLRTSMIGREITGFHSLLEWFLSRQGGRAQGYLGAMYSGVTTNYLAQLVGDLIERHPDLHGLFQVSGAPISKYHLLCLIRQAFKLDIEVEAVGGEVCDRTMRSARFIAATGIRCPGWPELISELSADPTPYDEWRSPKYEAIT